MKMSCTLQGTTEAALGVSDYEKTIKKGAR
jgi:hypothetical protein